VITASAHLSSDGWMRLWWPGVEVLTHTIIHKPNHKRLPTSWRTQRDAERGWTGGRSAERGCPEGVRVGEVQRAFVQQHKQEIPAQRSHW